MAPGAGDLLLLPDANDELLASQVLFDALSLDGACLAKADNQRQRGQRKLAARVLGTRAGAQAKGGGGGVATLAVALPAGPFPPANPSAAARALHGLPAPR
mmetsp:Transcript_136635/g.380825  ORF Transcript_136635/g.380825 Transcript_136635/m.380825 type:complete len:101 (+) Transcript_136635:137-439(+)